jgi:hypothetical protein
LRGKTAIGLPDVTQNRSDAAEYQALPEQSSKIADAASPEATNLALPHQSFARGSDFIFKFMATTQVGDGERSPGSLRAQHDR